MSISMLSLAMLVKSEKGSVLLLPCLPMDICWRSSGAPNANRRKYLFMRIGHKLNPVEQFVY
jgi:hypothetical protein